MAKGCSRRRIRGGGRTIEELEAAIATLPESNFKNVALDKITEAKKFPTEAEYEDMGERAAALEAAEAAVAAAEAAPTPAANSSSSGGRRRSKKSRKAKKSRKSKKNQKKN
jgi:hypothetical protein